MPWNLFPSRRPTISRTTIDLLFIVGMMVLFYGQPFLNPTLVSYGGDAFSLFVPSVDLYRQAMYNGVIPLWNPYTWMGAPFLAPYQAAVLYPFQLVSLSFQTSAAALNFGIFLSILWLAFGAYLFGVRALQLERFPSLLMAVTMSCSGFIGAHTDHVNQLAAISWIPWIMAEALILLRWPRLRSVVVLALCVGMQILAGHPQYVTYTFGYLMALAVCYFVYYYHRRKADDPPAWLGIVLLLVAVLAGYGLGAAQLLPSAELAQMSVRQVDSPERMFSFSYPPRHIVSMLYPNAFGNPVTGLHEFLNSKQYFYNFSEFTAYLGLGTIIFALLACFALFQEFPVRVFFLLSLLSLLGAFGEFLWKGIPYQVLMMMLPGGEHLRAPARFMIFFNLSVSVLAAMGFNQAFFYLRVRRRVRASTLTPLRVLVLLVVLFDLYLFSNNQVFRCNDTTAILEHTGGAWRYLEENPGYYKVFRQMDEVPYTTNENGEEIAEAVNFAHKGPWTFRQTLAEGLLRNESRERYRAEKRAATTLQVERLQTNLNVLAHVQTCSGYEEGLLPTISWLNSIGQEPGQDSGTALMGRFHRNLYNPRPDTILMGLLNTKYVMTDKPLLSERLRLLDASPGVATSRGNLTRWALYENLDFVPKFVWGKELRSLYNLDVLDVDSRRVEGLLSTDVQESNFSYRRDLTTATLSGARTAPIALTPIDYSSQPFGSPNGYQLRKDKSEAAELVMIEAAYPGWVCRWDTNRIELRRINAFMMGCYVPAGVERFSVSYEPFSFRLGLFISCVVAMLLCVGAVFHGVPRTPHPRPRRAGRSVLQRRS